MFIHAGFPSPLKFGDLLRMRWEEACEAIGIDPADIDITWDMGPYPHFLTKRGYAVAVCQGDGTYHIRFAKKTLDCKVHRADGLIRHEIGHIVDFFVENDKLNHWAANRGVKLPSTDERRADAIALAIWGEPIKYDKDLVQSTRVGKYPRPTHLGL
jgi:hypothetical protein